LNRDGVLAQIEGAAIYALNMTLNEELTVRDGRIVEGNVDTYPMLRLADMPKRLNVHMGGVTHHARFGAVGETGVGPIGPAIANAIFQATGHRARRTPLRKLDLRWT
jgi:isoquinoline 1-oxidoreductase beta subunit